MEEKKSVWNTYSETEKNALEELSSGYRDFLTKCKTERESVKEAVRLAEGKGYKDLKGILAGEDRLQPGDKVYAVCMTVKAVAFSLS